MHPSIFRAATTFKIVCLLFPANVQILHPSIEISNKGTVVDSEAFLFKNKDLAIVYIRARIESITVEKS